MRNSGLKLTFFVSTLLAACQGQTQPPEAPEALRALRVPLLAVDVDYGDRCLYISWREPVGAAFGDDSASFVIEREQLSPPQIMQLVVDRGNGKVRRPDGSDLADLEFREDGPRFCDPVAKNDDSGEQKWRYRVVEDRTYSEDVDNDPIDRSYTPFISANIHWPPVTEVNVLHGFGQPHDSSKPSAASTWILHTGIDFLGLQTVRIVRGGTCSESGTNEVTVQYLSFGTQRTDIYTHVTGGCPKDPACSDIFPKVCAGDELGSTVPIDDYPEVAHLHFEVRDRHGGWRNPLLIPQITDNDPGARPVHFEDLQTDGFILSVPGGMFANGQWTVSGRVDLLVDAFDLMCKAPDCSWPRVAPYRLEYWIENSLGDEVVASRDDPYVLFEFDKRRYFENPANIAATHLPSNATIESWPTSLSWVITNACARASEGTHCAEEAEHWNTLASASSGAKPNGQDAPDAISPSDRRFPNGDYLLWVRARDLQTPQESSFRLVVDN